MLLEDAKTLLKEWNETKDNSLGSSTIDSLLKAQKIVDIEIAFETAKGYGDENDTSLMEQMKEAITKSILYQK